MEVSTAPAEVDTKEETASSIVKTPSNDSSTINPSQDEPDTLSIIQKGQSMVPIVTAERKAELLQEARAQRRKWVQKIPLPYASARDPNNLWSLDDRLYPVQSSAASKRMTSATKILSELYGLERQSKTPEEIAQRVNELIKPIRSDEPIKEQDEQTLAEALLKDDSESLQSYHDFWKTLLKPECAMLIQGMLNFLGNLEGASMDRLAGAMKSYLDSTTESLKQHVAWRDRPDVDFLAVRRALESFVYGQAQSLLDKVEWTGLFSISDEEWVDRLHKLQFVDPNHLEIACLTKNSIPLDELLSEPIAAMTSIEQYYSPYEKLQRILAVYKGVNAALSTALNQNGDGELKLPSADDVLPTIILTVLKAKPTYMFRNLQLIEVFAPQEYLRGEAGYAYTNLYGAVQFLQDLNMEEPNSLSISPEDFRKGLAESVSKAQQRLIVDASDDMSALEKLSTDVDISVQDVREARLRGVTVDLEWAIQHRKDHPEKYGLDAGTSQPAPLPDGFSRSYSFLSANPQDIRLSDLPKLLAEYKMLVRTTEQLLGERGARLAQEKKRRDLERNQKLDDSFFGITKSPNARERSLTS